MKSSPKLLAVDLDGTLLDAHGNPHPRDAEALRALVERGTHVSIITGRLYSGTRASVLTLGLSGPTGCVDGSHMVSAATHTTLMHHGIQGPHSEALRRIFERAAPATFVFARDAIVYDETGDPYLGYVATWSSDVQRSVRVCEHAVWEEREGITAVVAVGTADQISEAASGIQDELRDIAQVAMFPIRRILGAWGLIVRASGGNKGSALEWIAEHHGISLEETVSVGDWLNDIPMLTKAGRSFAMGQAPDEVKNAATDVLPETSDEGGGVARVVEEAFGIRV
ncbi:HAD hydrolase family protein [Pendulispora brunnea]|uniref:HAD hydrolase family protein n=1 Tax=Pendulispora brunnea TaxID=2905690 RepID=A0ABZ2K8N3_9BACT